MVRNHHASAARRMADSVDAVSRRLPYGARHDDSTDGCDARPRHGGVTEHDVQSVLRDPRCAATTCLRRDAFFDLLPPFWRFQFEGRDAFVAQLRAISMGASTARVLRTVPTATGFVMEHEETQHGEQVEVARRLWLCEVRDGRITEVVGYCNGGWDQELRERHRGRSADAAAVTGTRERNDTMTMIDSTTTAQHVLDAVGRLAPTIAARSAEIEQGQARTG